MKIQNSSAQVFSNLLRQEAVPLTALCPSSDKVSRVFAAMLLGGFIGACLGGHTGAFVGAAVGLAISFFIEIRTTSRDLSVLDQIKDPKMEQAVKKVQELVSSKTITFTASQELHTLHDRVTEITDHVKTNCPDLNKPWEVFLRSMKGEKGTYPDGTEVTLDFSREISRLEGKKTKMIFERWTPSKTSKRALDEMYALQVECFGKKFAWGPAQLQHLDGGWLARQAGSKELLGFVLYRPDLSGSGMEISHVGRKADAAKLGIGERLLTYLFSEDHSHYGNTCSLHVRASNVAAQALYRKLGFTDAGKDYFYYGDPLESALVMTRSL